MTDTLLAGRYRLGEIIGTGGMSDVYATTDTLLGREVAVKMMRANLASDTTFKERFRREAQSAARLNHSAIVQVYDTGETTVGGISVPFIVMERVHGRTLRDIVRTDGPMSYTAAARTLLPVCDALQHSHDAGIIHRDVKPANIMITNTGAVKIMDFGIARAVGDAAASMTQTAAVIGTAQYLSPEQARGKSADARSDVYALGCVLYEAVTGRPPFEGESPFAVAFQHVQNDPTAPSEYIAHLSPAEALNIDAVVLTAMAKHPGDRYQSAREFARDLQLLSRQVVTNAARSHVHPQATPASTTGSHSTHGDHAARPVSPPTAAYPAAQPTVTPRPRTHTPGAPAAAAAAAPATPAPRPAAVRRGRNTAGWVIAALAAVTVAGGAVFAWEYTAGGGLAAPDPAASHSTVDVPALEGADSQEASRQLQDRGLKVKTQLEANPTVPANRVISTNPAPGSSVKKGSTIVLTVSSGKEQTDVPDLTGRTTEVAGTLLSRAGLKLDDMVGEVSSDTVPKGQVVSQKPAGGQRVAKGTTITITVSTGPAAVRVPVIVGQKWAQAESNLTAAGFTPKVDYVDSDQPADTVVSCEGEGTDKPKGSDIVVRVSNGQLVKMPDVTGMNPQQAFQALRAAGWTAPRESLHQQSVPTAALVDLGLIAAQDPPPGGLVHTDAIITISVNRFDPLAVLNNQ